MRATRFSEATGLICALLIGMGASVTRAQVIDMTFTGTISGGYDNAGLFGPAGESLGGDAFSATFEYNLDTPNADTGLGYYEGSYVSQYISGGTAYSAPTPIVSTSMTVNGKTVQWTDGAEYANASTNSTSGISSQAYDSSYFLYAGFYGAAPSRLADYGTYYVTPPASSCANLGSCYGEFYNNGQSTLGTLLTTSATISEVSPVPEPSTFVMGLFGGGLLMSLLWGRKARTACL
jgi:hypothetical protein